MPNGSKKKTVSFTDYSTASSTKQHTPETYRIKASVKLIPVHLLLQFWYTFYQADLEQNLHATLTRGLYVLIATQLVYAPLVLSAVVTSKGKPVKVEYQYLLFGVVGALASVPLLFVTVILFGAPFNTISENLMLASHMAVVLYPAVVLLAKLRVNGISLKAAAVVAVGAWLGAIAIPLDWDRPWQAWPLPIVGGTYLGGAAAYAVAWLY